MSQTATILVSAMVASASVWMVETSPHPMIAAVVMPYSLLDRLNGLRGLQRSGNVPSSRIRWLSSARYSSSSKSSGTSLPVQLDRWMALASRTPLMPSEPGAIKGVPS